ncbi:MAG: DUF3500 domain-containing protein, partial [Gemmataceae bacterium]|nr:DUF3500 domain-containing protein [Gemmataceae bacterium]
AEPQEAPANRVARPAEELVRELYASLNEEQRRQIVLPWNHGVGNNNATPTRMRMYNGALNRQPIGNIYNKQQQELITRILRSICSDDEGHRRITRNGTFDNSRTLDACGSHIFGDPTNNRQFAWVFTGHHLTVRCDGNSQPTTAFGGPMYYGHSPDGYSQRNVFNYQTRSVVSVFDALTEAQRRTAVLTGSPGENEGSVQFRAPGQPHPGIPGSELTMDQRRLVQSVMRDILSPYRREDADEVMRIVQFNGGMERIHLAFYRDQGATDNNRWHFWRLEGPGFVWNYRVLPHVHTFVNIAAVG